LGKASKLAKENAGHRDPAREIENNQKQFHLPTSTRSNSIRLEIGNVKLGMGNGTWEI
jgi:hypothetical protein